MTWAYLTHILKNKRNGKDLNLLVMLNQLCRINVDILYFKASEESLYSPRTSVDCIPQKINGSIPNRFRVVHAKVLWHFKRYFKEIHTNISCLHRCD
jgi:hypothetical protein